MLKYVAKTRVLENSAYRVHHLLQKKKKEKERNPKKTKEEKRTELRDQRGRIRRIRGVLETY